MFFIQGLFAQQQMVVGIGLSLIEGAVAERRPAVLPFVYAGVIHTLSEESGARVGEMYDQHGVSRLFDISLPGDDGLPPHSAWGFKKQYKKHELREDFFIQYRFLKQEKNTWLGGYEFPHGSLPGGPTRCVLTEVDDALFMGDIDAFWLETARKFSQDTSTVQGLGPAL